MLLRIMIFLIKFIQSIYDPKLFSHLWWLIECYGDTSNENLHLEHAIVRGSMPSTIAFLNNNLIFIHMKINLYSVQIKFWSTRADMEELIPLVEVLLHSNRIKHVYKVVNSILICWCMEYLYFTNTSDSLHKDLLLTYYSNARKIYFWYSEKYSSGR